MQSVNLNFVFDKTYDFYLAIKYVYYFKVLDYSQDQYYSEIKPGKWDGLYHRGWLSQITIVPKDENPAFTNDYDKSFIFNILKGVGIDANRDSDRDGIPDISDNKPYDSNNLSNVNIKEIFYNDLSITDKIYDLLGFKIQDVDKDGLPDSYENKIGTKTNNPDTDGDGLFDGQEIFSGTNPLNMDTDGDGVMDGLDTYPLDRTISYDSVDNDGDGIGDDIEIYTETDPNNPDTDGDNIPDNMDIYPLNPTNIPRLEYYIKSYKESFNNNTASVQNSFLSSATDVVLIVIMFLTPIFFIMVYKLYKAIQREFDHYYHGFHNAFGYEDVFPSDNKHNGHKSHTTSHTTPQNSDHQNKAEHKSDIHHKEESDNRVSEEQNNILNITPPPDFLPGDSLVNMNNNTAENSGRNINENNNLNNVDDGGVVKVLTQKELEWKGKLKEVLDYAKEDNPVFWKIAIIEADSILEAVLYDRGYSGKNMADRLKSANFKTINEAWNAHKIRNKIAHNDPSGISKRQIKESIQCYIAVFREFGISE